MIIYDDIFSWKGWGGQFNLAAGKCRLRIVDLSRKKGDNLTHLKPIIVIVSDLPSMEESSYKSVSVKSCCSHIATSVVREFGIDPSRMIFVEYYPETVYGEKQQHSIGERYEVVDLQWHDKKALHPSWRSLKPPLLDTLRELMVTESARSQGHGENVLS